MGLITESELRSFGKTEYSVEFSKNALESYRAESKANKTTIFLSHKHDESNEILDGAIQFLNGFDVEVYMDWLDEEMPKFTSGETAKKIKEKIRENDKFILLST